MLKVFASQKAFSGFSSIIPGLNSTISPQISTKQVNRHFSNPPLPFSSFFQVMLPEADLLGSL